MKFKLRSTSFIVVLSLIGQHLFASEVNEEVVLPSIIIGKKTPAEVLSYDSMVPKTDFTLGNYGTTGFVDQDFARKAPIAVNQYGYSGALTQLRGLARSSSDTNVQALGVPLNLPQGGGFDLSVFPSFLWSHASFQLGQSFVSMNPYSQSGALSLTPWTASAVNSRSSEFTKPKVSGVYTDPGIYQGSLSSRLTSGVAATVGVLKGKTRGVSGGTSAVLLDKAQTRLSVHMLGTQVESDSLGSTVFPTPNATQETIRLIPFLQLDHAFTKKGLLKTSVYGDYSKIVYDEPDSGFLSEDISSQLGTESVFIYEPWKWGLGFRQVRFNKVDFEAPIENIFFIQAARKWSLGQSYEIESKVKVTQAGRFKAFPSMSLTGQKSFNQKSRLFIKLSYSSKVPSLVDRYYEMPGMFQGNPNLGLERAVTFLVGSSWDEKNLQNKIQIYLQRLNSVQLPVQASDSLMSVENQGSAQMLALLHSIRYQITPKVALSNSLSLTQSYVFQTNQPYYYQPMATEIFTLDIQPFEILRETRVGVDFRAQSSRVYNDQGERLPGVSVFDFWATYGSSQSALNFGMRVNNGFNKETETVKNYPSQGRSFSFFVTGLL